MFREVIMHGLLAHAHALENNVEEERKFQFIKKKSVGRI